MLGAGLPIVAICLLNKRPANRSIFLHSAVGNFLEDSFFDEETWQQVKRSAITRLEFGTLYGGGNP